MDLEKFASQNERQSHSWCDGLPAEIQEQIISTDCSVRVVVMWLKDQGYEAASVGKVDLWRRGKRIDRERPQ